MSNEKWIEEIRVLWEAIMFGGKLVICTEELNGSGVLDVNILKLLYSHPDTIPKEIAGKLNIPNSTLTHVINRLEKKGLIERKLNTNDLRSLQILLTDEGRQAIVNHHNEEKKLISKIAEMLDENETAVMLKILKKLSEQL